jgi:hypothetical protein
MVNLSHRTSGFKRKMDELLEARKTEELDVSKSPPTDQGPEPELELEPQPTAPYDPSQPELFVSPLHPTMPGTSQIFPQSTTEEVTPPASAPPFREGHQWKLQRLTADPVQPKEPTDEQLEQMFPELWKEYEAMPGKEMSPFYDRIKELGYKEGTLTDFYKARQAEIAAYGQYQALEKHGIEEMLRTLGFEYTDSKTGETSWIPAEAWEFTPDQLKPEDKLSGWDALVAYEEAAQQYPQQLYTMMKEAWQGQDSWDTLVSEISSFLEEGKPSAARDYMVRWKAGVTGANWLDQVIPLEDGTETSFREQLEQLDAWIELQTNLGRIREQLFKPVELKAQELAKEYYKTHMEATGLTFAEIWNSVSDEGKQPFMDQAMEELGKDRAMIEEIGWKAPEWDQLLKTIDAYKAQWYDKLDPEQQAALDEIRAEYEEAGSEPGGIQGFFGRLMDIPVLGDALEWWHGHIDFGYLQSVIAIGQYANVPHYWLSERISFMPPSPISEYWEREGEMKVGWDAAKEEANRMREQFPWYSMAIEMTNPLYWIPGAAVVSWGMRLGKLGKPLVAVGYSIRAGEVAAAAPVILPFKGAGWALGKVGMKLPKAPGAMPFKELADEATKYGLVLKRIPKPPAEFRGAKFALEHPGYGVKYAHNLKEAQHVLAQVALAKEMGQIVGPVYKLIPDDLAPLARGAQAAPTPEAFGATVAEKVVVQGVPVDPGLIEAAISDSVEMSTRIAAKNELARLGVKVADISHEAAFSPGKIPGFRDATEFWRVARGELLPDEAVIFPSGEQMNKLAAESGAALWDMPNLEMLVEHGFTENQVANLLSKFRGRVPWVKRLQDAADPSFFVEDRLGKLMIGYLRMLDYADSARTFAGTILDFNTKPKIVEKTLELKNVGAPAGASTAWYDVFSRPQFYTLVEGEKAYMEAFWKLTGEVEGLLAKHNIPINKMYLQPGERYIARIVKSVDRKVQKVISPIKRRVGAKMPFEKPRKFEFAKEGMEWGVKYEADPTAAMSAHVWQAYKKIADTEFARLVKPYGVSPLEKVRRAQPYILDNFDYAVEQLAQSNKLRQYLAKLKTSKGGAKLEGAEMAKVQRDFPDFYEEILRLYALAPKSFDQVMRAMKPEVWQLLRVTPEKFAQRVKAAARLRQQQSITPEVIKGSEAALGLKELRQLAKDKGWRLTKLAKPVEMATGRKTVLGGKVVPETGLRHFTLRRPGKRAFYLKGSDEVESFLRTGGTELMKPKHLRMPKEPPANMILMSDVNTALKSLGVEAKASLNMLDDLYRGASKNRAVEYEAAVGDMLSRANAIHADRRMMFQKAQKAKTYAVEEAKTPVAGDEATINHPAFQGQLFDVETAARLSAMLDDVGAPWVEFMAKASGYSVSAVAAFDWSAPFIQGLPVLGLKPRIWAEATVRHYGVFFHPKSYDNWLLQPDNWNAAHEGAMYGLHVGRHGYFEYGPQLTRLAEKIPVAGKLYSGAYRRFEGAFNAYGNMCRIMLWKALKPHVTPDQYIELAQSVNKMTGVISRRGQGISATQRGLEKAFVSFAPSYRFAAYALIGNLVRGGVTGSLARRSLLQFLGGGTLFYVGVCMMLGQKPKLNPFTDGSRLFSIEVGEEGEEHWVGIGSAFTSVVRLFGDIGTAIAEDPSRLYTIKREDLKDNVFIKFFVNQTSPVTSLGVALWENKNYLGEPLENLGEWARTLADRVTPISLQSVFLQEPAANLPAFLGELSGLRTHPKQPWEYRDEERNTTAVELADKYGWINKYKDGERAPSCWDDLSENQKDICMEENERLRHWTQKAREKWKSRNPVESGRSYEIEQAFEDEATRYADDINIIAEQFIHYLNLRERLEAGDATLTEEEIKNAQNAGTILRDRLADAGNTHRGVINGLKYAYADIISEIEKHQKENPSEHFEDIAYHEYMGMMYENESLYDEWGQYDYDAADAALEDFKARWGEDTYNTCIDRLTRGKEEPPIITKLRNARKLLDDIGYWEVTNNLQGVYPQNAHERDEIAERKAEFYFQRDYPQMSSYYNKYLEWEKIDPARAREIRNHAIWPSIERARNACYSKARGELLTLKTAIEAEHARLRRQYPKADQYLMMFYDRAPLTTGPGELIQPILPESLVQAPETSALPMAI